jgi:hypothetical protein
MKPTDAYTGHVTFDLTECKVHALKNADGSTRIVARYPKAWEAPDPVTLNAVNGTAVTMRPYKVTDWYEVVLMDIPKA